MKQTETKFKEKALQELRKVPSSYFEKIQQVAIRGTPDILGVVAGLSVVLELKVDAPIEKLQTYKTKKWQRAGAYVKILTPDNLYETVKELREIANFYA